ncbi:MAG: hypothetical protein COB23_00560 [Methylophaga sp.]|nr:MAG: hypothetical protein COB23_00560 [Methylophaga sp.]
MIFKRNAIEQKALENHSQLALIFIGLDEFKSINNTYGHGTGDKVLTKVARIFDDSVRQGDIVARLGEMNLLLFSLK